MDPLYCACTLMPLATWVKRHRIRGITCVEKSGKLITIDQIEELCLGKSSKCALLCLYGILFVDAFTQWE